MKNSSFFRIVARQALTDKWAGAIGVGFVASVLGGINGFSATIEVDKDLNVFTLLNLNAILAAFALSLFVGSIIAVGYATYNLKLVDGKFMSIGDLFLHFSNYTTIVLTTLIKWVIILFLSIFLFVFGIIAYYNYALTNYILAENPDVTPTQALKLSKSMMKGNRFRLFCLEFSFLGWAILCIFTFGIGVLWLNPYISAAKTAFYRDLCDDNEQIDFNETEE